MASETWQAALAALHRAEGRGLRPDVKMHSAAIAACARAARGEPAASEPVGGLGTRGLTAETGKQALRSSKDLQNQGPS